MFSENQKISGRQAFRLLTYDLLGLSTLLVPTVLAHVAGRDGIFGIIIGVAAALIYLKLIAAVLKDMKVSFPEYLLEKLGTFGGRIAQAGYVIYFVLLAGYTAYLFSDIVLDNLLREESFWLVLSLILLLAVYGIWDGIEGRARAYELLFWFVMVPLFLMLFSALNEIQADYWTPVFYSETAGVLGGGYYVFVCFALVFLVLFMGNYVAKKETLLHAGRMALIFAGVVHAGLYLILLGIFGVNALGVMDFPAVTLMSTVKISGGFLKRTDAFMLAIWFFTLYAVLSSAAFYGGTVLQQMFGGKAAKKPAAGRIASVAVLLLAFAAAGIFYRSEAACYDYEFFLWYIGTPFLVLVLLLLLPNRKKVVRGTLMTLALLSVTLISGCNTAELEDKNFPIEVAVDETRDFGAEWLNEESGGNRMVDYNHLKVIILSRAFLEDEDGMEEFLNLLEEKNEVPRNTYVVAAEDAGAILELGEEMGESVGSYLEEYLENVSEVEKKAYPTLGMLYQEKENQTETLLIPFVEESDGKPKVERYYVWKRGAAAGTVDGETALLYFFTANQLEAYTLIPAEGHYVRLFASRNEISFSGSGEERQIVVDIYCSGEVLYQREREALTEGELETQIEAYMNEMAETVRMWQDIDVTNSYKKLGGYQRDWYAGYLEDASGYERDMNIVYNVHITWVNL